MKRGLKIEKIKQSQLTAIDFMRNLVRLAIYTLLVVETLGMVNKTSLGIHGCVLYHAQHKSAGATMMNTLRGGAVESYAPKDPVKIFRVYQQPYDLGDWRARCHGNSTSCGAQCKMCEYSWTFLENSNFLWDAWRLAIPADRENKRGVIPPPSQMMDSSRDLLERNRHRRPLKTAHLSPLPKYWRPDQCLVVTMFREPISRLVSALHYCRGSEKGTGPRSNLRDPLCGTVTNEWINQATPVEFSALWGNFLMRDLLAHPFARVTIGSKNETFRFWGSIANQSTATGNVRSLRVWESWKVALQGGDEISTPAGKLNLQEVMETVMPLLQVPFVVEQWSSSCAILDCVAPLRGGSWAQLTAANIERHGSGKWHSEQLAALVAAKSSEDILRNVAADILIYKAACAKMKKLHDELSRHTVNRSIHCIPEIGTQLPNRGLRFNGGSGLLAVVEERIYRSDLHGTNSHSTITSDDLFQLGN